MMKKATLVAIIFAFMIFIFITNKKFITFDIKVDLDKCYNDKKCNYYLSKNFKKQ